MCLVLIGKSASGKDAIRSELIVKHGFHPIVTYTTRPMRDGEVDGVTYHYISDDEFIQKIEDGFFAEYKTYLAKIDDNQYKKWRYGLSKESLETADENTVVILTPGGVRDILKYNLDMKVVWVYANHSTIKKRLDARISRGIATKEECERRTMKDDKDFNIADVLANRIIYNNYGRNLNDVIAEILNYYRE